VYKIKQKTDHAIPQCSFLAVGVKNQSTIGTRHDFCQELANTQCMK